MKTPPCVRTVLFSLLLAGLASERVALAAGCTTPSFAPPGVFASGGSNPFTVVVADFNSDGKPDLAVANSELSAPSVSILLGNGDGTFQAPVNYHAGTRP